MTVVGAGRGRQDPGRAGGRARRPTPRPCCCSPRSPTRPRSRTPWRRRCTCTSSRATSWRPASRCSATGPGCWWSTTASTCSTRRATTVDRAPVGVPAAVRAGHQPRAARAARRVRLPAGAARASRARRGGPGAGPRRSRSSSTGPAGSAPAPRPRPPSCGWSPTSSAASTGCRWRSSSPPAGCPTFSLADLHRRLDRALDLLGGRPGGERPAPDAARHRRVVLPAARRRRAAAVPVPVGLRRRDRARRRRAARRRPGPGGRPRHGAVPAGRRLDARRRVHRGRHPLPDAGDAARVRARPARRRGRGRRRRRTACSGGRSSSPRGSARRCHRARARGGRRAAPRAGEPAGGVAAGPRPRTPSTTAAAMVTALYDAIDLPRPDRDPRLGRGAGRRFPATRRRTRARPPCWAPPARPPTTAVTTPRAERLGPARAASAATDDAGIVVLPCAGWPWSPWRAGRTPRSSSTASPRPQRRSGWARRSGSPRSPRPTPATSTRRGSCTRAGSAGAPSPSMRAWSDYVAGEIESLAGHAEAAERHYLRAIDLARGSGATFLVGVATVGLLARARQHRSGRRRAARLPRRRRLLRPHRQLAPPVAGAAQPRGPAAPHRRPRPRGGPRRGRRPGSGRPRPRRCPATGVVDHGPEPRRTSSPSPGTRSSGTSARVASRPASRVGGDRHPGRLDERLLADPRRVAGRHPGSRSARRSASPARPAPGPCAPATSGGQHEVHGQPLGRGERPGSPAGRRPGASVSAPQRAAR